MGPRYGHGSHIFGLTNFPDFSSIFFPFSSIFSLFHLMNLTITKIYLTNTLQLKSRRKKTKIKIGPWGPELIWYLATNIK